MGNGTSAVSNKSGSSTSSTQSSSSSGGFNPCSVGKSGPPRPDEEAGVCVGGDAATKAIGAGVSARIGEVNAGGAVSGTLDGTATVQGDARIHKKLTEAVTVNAGVSGAAGFSATGTTGKGGATVGVSVREGPVTITTNGGTTATYSTANGQLSWQPTLTTEARLKLSHNEVFVSDQTSSRIKPTGSDVSTLLSVGWRAQLPVGRNSAGEITVIPGLSVYGNVPLYASNPAAPGAALSKSPTAAYFGVKPELGVGVPLPILKSHPKLTATVGLDSAWVPQPNGSIQGKNAPAFSIGLVGRF
jgi:hypothetical protein